jgi:hypothetical protein
MYVVILGVSSDPMANATGTRPPLPEEEDSHEIAAFCTGMISDRGGGGEEDVEPTISAYSYKKN